MAEGMSAEIPHLPHREPRVPTAFNLPEVCNTDAYLMTMGFFGHENADEEFRPSTLGAVMVVD